MTTLAPNTDSAWLPVATVIQRAAAEFACVVTDQKRAMKHLADGLVADGPDVDQQTADEYLQPLAESVEMICADDRHAEEQFLKCFVVPEQPKTSKPVRVATTTFSGHSAGLRVISGRTRNGHQARSYWWGAGCAGGSCCGKLREVVCTRTE